MSVELAVITNANQPRGRAINIAQGFTLIEIMIVVTILGILGAIIVPNFIGRLDQARVTAAEANLRSIGAALDLYRLDNFQYPGSEQGIEALVTKPSGFPEPKNYNPDGYRKSLPMDPWGSPYVYEKTGSAYSLYSLGADGAEGGEGYDADIRLEDL